MEVPDGGPPKALTIMHQVPEMDPHVFSYVGRLHVHDGHVPLDKSQGAQSWTHTRTAGLQGSTCIRGAR